MQDILTVVIGLGIVYTGIVLIGRQKELKNELKRMKDQNIEFSGYEGSGIQLINKEYETLDDKHIHGSGMSEPTKGDK